jgi:hypothetical protein
LFAQGFSRAVRKKQQQMKLQLALCLVALFAVFAAAQQRDEFHGHYWTDCTPFGQGTGMYAKHFFIFVNSGYFSRMQLYVNDPQCAQVFFRSLSSSSFESGIHCLFVFLLIGYFT